MDKDFIWEAEYGRREYLRNILKDLLRKQNADSLQCLALYVNNNPYNLEFLYLQVTTGQKRMILNICRKNSVRRD